MNQNRPNTQPKYPVIEERKLPMPRNYPPTPPNVKPPKPAGK